MDLRTVSQQERLEVLKKSRFYRHARREFSEDQESVETAPQILNPRRYWEMRERDDPNLHLFYPPAVNYAYMDEDDWEIPQWDQMLELQEMVVQQPEAQQPGDQQELQPAEEPVDVQQGQAQLQDISLHGSVNSDDSDLYLSSEEQSEGSPRPAERGAAALAQDFHRMARNPESANQVNMNRVCNLDNLPVVEDDQHPDSSSAEERDNTEQQQAQLPARPRRDRNKPQKFDDFHLY